MTTRIKTASQLLAEREVSGLKPQIVDVRAPSEFESGHLPGAINIPMETIESRLADLDLEAPTILVCQSGTRASVACAQVGHRFRNIAVLEGGTNSWIDTGGSVVRSTRSGKPLMQQALLGAGIVNAIGVLLAIFVHPGWIGLSAFVAAGLIVAGSTGFCLMAILLAKMPWNRKPNGSPATCSKA